MTENTPNPVKFYVDVQGTPVEMSPSEARDLYNALKDIFMPGDWGHASETYAVPACPAPSPVWPTTPHAVPAWPTPLPAPFKHEVWCNGTKLGDHTLGSWNEGHVFQVDTTEGLSDE